MIGSNTIALSPGQNAHTANRGLNMTPFPKVPQKYKTFLYFRGSLKESFVEETVRCDLFKHCYLVSACQRNWFVRTLEKIFPYVVWYGRRELILIHVPSKS